MSTDQPAKEFLPDLALGKITQHPDNPRHNVGDVTDLAVSIKDHGVLEPLVVVPATQVTTDLKAVRGKDYCLVAGHRRLTAAKEAKVKTVPVIVRHDLVTREEQVAAMVIENQHRADLSPVEEGEAYQLLLDITPKSTQAKVAAAVGMPKKRVSERLRLTKLNDTAKTAIHDGQLSLTDALELLTIETRHPDLAEKAALAAGTPEFKYEIARAKQDATVLDRYDRYRAKANELDTKILDKAPTYGPDQPRYVNKDTPNLDIPEGTDPAEVTMAVGAAHAGCPGAAVYIPKTTNASYQLDWYCTDFRAHHTPSREEQAAENAAGQEEREQARAAAEEARLSAMTDEERAAEAKAAEEEAAAEQAHAERAAALDAAQATRRAHFTDVINQGETALAKLALVEMCGQDPFADGLYGETNLAHSALARELLGLARDAGPDTATDALRHLKVEQIALLLWFVNTEGLDDELTLAPWQRGQALDNIDPEYIRVLTDRYGYQWSSIERTEFNLDEHGHVQTDDDVEGGEAA